MQRSSFSMPIARLRAVPLLLVLLLACEEDALSPLAPAPAGDAGFYPLAVGSAWTYLSTRHVEFIAPDGSDVRPPIHQRATTTREIVVQESIAGQVWSVEEDRSLVDGAEQPTVTWRRWREDPTGLYRADLLASIPPGGATDVTSVDAARRFGYPREVGAEWLLRDDDQSARGTLVTIDVLASGIGERSAFLVEYRFRDDGPKDWRRFWYSECGILRSEVRAEVEATDAISGRRLTIVSTVTTEIVSIHPACPGRPALHP